MIPKDLAPPTVMWAITVWSLWVSGASFRWLKGHANLGRVVGVLSGALFWPGRSRKPYLLITASVWLAVSLVVYVFGLLVTASGKEGVERFVVAVMVSASYWDLLESVFTSRGLVFVPLLQRLLGARSLHVIRAIFIAGSFFQLLGAFGYSRTTGLG